MRRTKQTVHTNRVQPLLEPSSTLLTDSRSPSASWVPHLFIHGEGTESLPVPSSVPQPTLNLPPPVITRSGRMVRPVNHYGNPITH